MANVVAVSPPPLPPPPSQPQRATPPSDDVDKRSKIFAVDSTREGGRDGEKEKARMRRTMVRASDSTSELLMLQQAAWYFGISLLSAWAIGR
eukprot:745886-Hanusia_phi.AAC.9